MITHTILTLYQRKSAWVIAMAAVGVLVSLYIFQVNALTASAYHLSDLESKVEIQRQEMQELEARYIQAPAFETLEELAQERNFEKATEVAYIRASGSIVAQSQ